MEKLNITKQRLLDIGFKSHVDGYYTIDINEESYIYCNVAGDGWDMGIATRYEDEDCNEDETLIPLYYTDINTMASLVELLIDKNK